MHFFWPTWKVPCFVIIASAMVFSAMAQDGGQEIIFSSPKTTDVPPVTPSLMPQNSDLTTLPGAFQAPAPAFPSPSRNELPPRLPGPARPRPLPQERQNWMLMTPAEIFGVMPSENLLKPVERDALGREKKTSQLERYLARENQPLTGATNGWRNERTGSPWNFSREADAASPFARARDGMGNPAQTGEGFLDRPLKRDAAGNQAGQPEVNGLDPLTQKKINQEKLEQLATMERFRQMLQPSAPSASASGSRYFPVSKPLADPNLTQPDFVPNPAGASFTPLSSSMGRPAGLTPLPGIFTPRPKPVVVPDWKPKPPPWLSQSPTAFPQQKF